MSGLLKHWRIAAPVILVCSLLLTIVPSALAATPGNTASPSAAKEYYLALGDSLAFGFQPNLDFRHGYVDDLSKYLVNHDDEFQPVANMACNGETSSTMLNGKCPYPSLRKYPYKGAQFEAALDYLHQHAGHVALVTLDIGANDTDSDINLKTCKIEKQKFTTDLATLDKNLKQTILPGLQKALTVNGQVTGQLIVMNYYDPYQNICPNTVPLHRRTQSTSRQRRWQLWYICERIPCLWRREGSQPKHLHLYLDVPESAGYPRYRPRLSDHRRRF